jgi:hypothetical protein
MVYEPGADPAWTCIVGRHSEARHSEAEIAESLAELKPPPEFAPEGLWPRPPT